MSTLTRLYGHFANAYGGDCINSSVYILYLTNNRSRDKVRLRQGTTFFSTKTAGPKSSLASLVAYLGTMNIPDIDTFHNHGLYDIVIDSSGSRSVGQSASGWANLRSTLAYPLLQSAPEGIVKFYWCSNTDRDLTRQFRRRCQAYAIATLPSGPADKGKQIDNGHRVLAWWQTDGLWMVTNEPVEDVVSLGTWWSDRLVEQQAGEAHGHGNSEAAGLKNPSHGMIYADACEVFAGMSTAIKVRYFVIGRTDKSAYTSTPYYPRCQSAISIRNHSKATTGPICRDISLSESIRTAKLQPVESNRRHTIRAQLLVCLGSN